MGIQPQEPESYAEAFRKALDTVKNASNPTCRFNKQIRVLSLPSLPSNFDFSVLNLRIRTENALRSADIWSNSDQLAEKTIGDLLTLKNFGILSLVDLMTALLPLVELQDRGLDNSAQFLIPIQNSLFSNFPQQPSLIIQQENRTNPKKLRVEAVKLHKIPTATKIRRDDFRLGKLIHQIDLKAQTAFELASRLLENNFVPLNSENTIKQMRELRRTIIRFRRMTLEDELMSLLEKDDKRNQKIIVRRYGLDGRGNVTLQEAGEKYGLTRERVRQICNRWAKRFSDSKPFLPILSRAIRLIRQNAPITVDRLEALFLEQGVSATPFCVEGIIEASPVLGKKLRFSIYEIKGKRYLLADRDARLVNIIHGRAKRAIEHWGATTIEEIAATVSEKIKRELNAEFIADVLQSRADFRWLDEKGGWFWLDIQKRNRLINQIRKILSVTESVEISELRSGVSRHHRMQGVSPPKRVLLELCRQIEWCRVENETIYAEPPLNWGKELSHNEQIFALVLLENGAFMERTKLEEMCREQLEMTSSTFYAYLCYSPILVRYAMGIYGLRGAKIEAGKVESMLSRSTRRRTNVLQDFGWREDGNIWLAYLVSPAILQSGVIGLPAAIINYISGDFDLQDAESQSLGLFRAKGTSAWGLNKVFRRRGGEVGDYMILLFDLSKRKVIFHLGDESLLDDFQTSDT